MPKKPKNASKVFDLLGGPSSTSEIVAMTASKKTARDPVQKALHSRIERRRKERMNEWLQKINEILPKDNRKETIVLTLERAYHFIVQLKESNENLMSDALRDSEVLKEFYEQKDLIEKLSLQVEKYADLLKIAGVPIPNEPAVESVLNDWKSRQTKEMASRNQDEAKPTISKKSIPKKMAKISPLIKTSNDLLALAQNSTPASILPNNQVIGFPQATTTYLLSGNQLLPILSQGTTNNQFVVSNPIVIPVSSASTSNPTGQDEHHLVDELVDDEEEPFELQPSTSRETRHEDAEESEDSSEEEVIRPRPKVRTKVIVCRKSLKRKSRSDLAFKAFKKSFTQLMMSSLQMSAKSLLSKTKNDSDQANSPSTSTVAAAAATQRSETTDADKPSNEVTEGILNPSTPTTHDILMLESLSSPPGSVQSVSNSSLPNFLCLSPSDQLAEYHHQPDNGQQHSETTNGQRSTEGRKDPEKDTQRPIASQQRTQIQSRRTSYSAESLIRQPTAPTPSTATTSSRSAGSNYSEIVCSDYANDHQSTRTDATNRNISWSAEKLLHPIISSSTSRSTLSQPVDATPILPSLTPQTFDPLLSSTTNFMMDGTTGYGRGFMSPIPGSSTPSSTSFFSISSHTSPSKTLRNVQTPSQSATPTVTAINPFSCPETQTVIDPPSYHYQSSTFNTNYNPIPPPVFGGHILSGSTNEAPPPAVFLPVQGQSQPSQSRRSSTDRSSSRTSTSSGNVYKPPSKSSSSANKSATSGQHHQQSKTKSSQGIKSTGSGNAGSSSGSSSRSHRSSPSTNASSSSSPSSSATRNLPTNLGPFPSVNNPQTDHQHQQPHPHQLNNNNNIQHQNQSHQSQQFDYHHPSLFNASSSNVVSSSSSSSSIVQSNNSFHLSNILTDFTTSSHHATNIHHSNHHQMQSPSQPPHQSSQLTHPHHQQHHHHPIDQNSSSYSYTQYPLPPVSRPSNTRSSRPSASATSTTTTTSPTTTGNNIANSQSGLTSTSGGGKAPSNSLSFPLFTPFSLPSSSSASNDTSLIIPSSSSSSSQHQHQSSQQRISSSSNFGMSSVLSSSSSSHPHHPPHPPPHHQLQFNFMPDHHHH